MAIINLDLGCLDTLALFSIEEIYVSLPTLSTRTAKEPATTKEPANTVSPLVFFTGTDSPVNNDSLTSKICSSKTIQSAGI